MPRRTGWRRTRDEAGYAALLVALLASTVLIGLCAVGVDMSRWYVEMQRAQKAADAAALAGVTWLPANMPEAQATALSVANENGYTAGPDTQVTTGQGALPSQLKVTVTHTIPDVFGAFFGIHTTTISRTAVADYTAPAPMGSPCNTFGNEPPGPTLPDGTVSALPSPAPSNCTSNPQFWGAIEGPATDKVQGDRFMTTACSGTSNAGATYGCSAGKNTETSAAGYFFSVHVEPGAVGTPIAIQIYDPAFVNTGATCTGMSGLTGATNPFAYNGTTPDNSTRYSTSTSYCAGDSYPCSAPSSCPTTPPPATTSYVLREQTDTENPLDGAPVSGCNEQFVGQTAPPTAAELTATTTTTTGSGSKRVTTTSNSTSYNLEKAETFHAWYPLCTFTPAREGDYYLQVRTNVDTTHGTAVPNVNPAGKTLTPLIYTGNPDAYAATGDTTSGSGANSFAIRAIPSNPADRSLVSVSGHDNMPILQNASGSTATFNLIRALPTTQGENIAFDFFDAGDATASGTVKVIPPSDATGSLKGTTSIPNCLSAMDLGSYSAVSGCTATIKKTTNDGQVEHLVVPIPPDYGCNASTLSGCWFQVQITFPGATSVTDFTTWSANIVGDPVRLVQ